MLDKSPLSGPETAVALTCLGTARSQCTWRGEEEEGGTTDGDEIRNAWECRQTTLGLGSHFKELDLYHKREEKPWQIHVNVRQNQYSIVKQNEVKIKIKKKRERLVYLVVL